MKNLLARICSSNRRAWTILGAVLREIFDESAYARFLERRQLTTSPDAYAEFLAESRQQRERRPRCC
ncbi:MAG TPA: hypothetical protein VFA40_06365 [Terriglobales bacterium]|jgi:hypothetical protein|nr:hypothetical protein [Terriglobales bacterium]